MYKIKIEDKKIGNQEFSTEGYLVAVIEQEGMHKGNVVIINGDSPVLMDIFMINFFSNLITILKKRFSTKPDLLDIFNKTSLMIENLK